MGRLQAIEFVEGYLYRARGHRALEQSVLAAGERAGFSERRLRRAGRSIGIDVGAYCWELPAARRQSCDAQVLLELAPIPRSLPALGVIAPAPVRSRRAA